MSHTGIPIHLFTTGIANQLETVLLLYCTAELGSPKVFSAIEVFYKRLYIVLYYLVAA